MLTPYPMPAKKHLSLLNESSLETLGTLDIDGLNVAVQFLFCTLFVVSFAADTDTESVWDTLDTGLPDLLV
jgi:hypothetical protein